MFYLHETTHFKVQALITVQWNLGSDFFFFIQREDELSFSSRLKKSEIRQQVQSENNVCVLKFDEVMRDGLSLYPSKLT